LIKSRNKKITWSINDNGCWICTSHSSKGRYLTYYVNGKSMMMHRYMYEKYKGKIPDGILACHTCDNTSCINPDHLFLGTQADNMADMVKKGRQSTGRINNRGQGNGSHKLTEKQVCSIKYDYPCSTRTEIAKIFNISISMVSHIMLNKNWKHI